MIFVNFKTLNLIRMEENANELKFIKELKRRQEYIQKKAEIIIIMKSKNYLLALQKIYILLWYEGVQLYN